MERERLRYLITTEEAETDPVYKKIYEANKKSIAKEESETAAEFNTRMADKSYEEYIRDKALDNTLNFYKLFYHKTESMGQRLLDVIKDYPHLEVEYPVLKQFATRVGGRGVQGLEGLTNILLRNQRDMDTAQSNSYNRALKNLANPDVIKVKDEAENRRISSLFRALPIFAFLQTGMSRGEFSFTSVVPFEDYTKIMQEPMRAMKEWFKPKEYDIKSKEAKALLEEEAKIIELKGSSKYTFKTEGDKLIVYNTGILDRFWASFLTQNSRANVSIRNKLKTYLYNSTPAALKIGRAHV